MRYPQAGCQVFSGYRGPFAAAERVGSPCPPRIPIPGHGEPAHAIAGHALIAFRAIARTEARLTRAEAALIDRLRRGRAETACGFSSFADFSREVLGVTPTTARRRLALHAALQESPPLAEAFDHGSLSVCQVLELRTVARGSAAPFWIELAQNVTLRELRRRLQEDQPPKAATDGTEDAPGRTIRFSAPAPAALAWEHGLETARRVLGYEAPVHLCVDALLSEVHAALPEENLQTVATLPRPHAPPGPRPIPKNVPPPAERDVAPLRVTLALIERELHELEWLRHTLGREAGSATEPGRPSPDQIHELVARFQEWNRAPRGLRLLTGRLLRDLIPTRAIAALGCRNLREFAENHLGLSERSAQGLIAQAYLFDDEPILAHAFETGAIGLSQAFLIRRIALPDTLRAFIQRAGRLTTLHFAREVRFLERLRELLPDFRTRFAGPLPEPHLDRALVEALHDAGWNAHELAAHLRARGLPEPADADPATNPLLFRRLEVLLELLVLAREQGPPASPTPGHDAASTSGRDPQMLAPGFAGPVSTTIHFWLPDPIADTWDDAVRRLGAGPERLPTWAAAMLIVQHAVAEWERIDPTRIPTEHKILERDGYRCRVPGCTSRRTLEAHHIIHKGQEGPDDPWNRITLCHDHHQHRIHGPHTARVSGQAPGNLTWELGTGRGKRPWRTYHGEKIVK